jgi:hypothetical protein
MNHGTKFCRLCLKLLLPTILTSSLPFYPYQKDEWALPGYLLTRCSFFPSDIKHLSLSPRCFLFTSTLILSFLTLSLSLRLQRVKKVWNVRFSRQWVWRWQPSGILRHVRRPTFQRYLLPPPSRRWTSETPVNFYEIIQAISLKAVILKVWNFTKFYKIVIGLSGRGIRLSLGLHVHGELAYTIIRMLTSIESVWWLRRLVAGHSCSLHVLLPSTQFTKIR